MNLVCLSLRPYNEGITEEVDYEGELGVVIGRRGKGISESDAYDYVFGQGLCIVVCR